MREHGLVVGDLDALWEDAKASIAAFKARLEAVRPMSLVTARDVARQGLAMAAQTLAVMATPEYKALGKERVLPAEGAVPYWQVKWHVDNVNKEILAATAAKKDPNAVEYKDAEDLKRWVIGTFMASVNSRTSKAGYDEIEQAFWDGVKSALAAQVDKFVYGITHPLETATGIPAWAWWVGGGTVTAFLGYALYRIALASAERNR